MTFEKIIKELEIGFSTAKKEFEKTKSKDSLKALDNLSLECLDISKKLDKFNKTHAKDKNLKAVCAYNRDCANKINCLRIKIQNVIYERPITYTPKERETKSIFEEDANCMNF